MTDHYVIWNILLNKFRETNGIIIIKPHSFSSTHLCQQAFSTHLYQQKLKKKIYAESCPILEVNNMSLKNA